MIVLSHTHFSLPHHYLLVTKMTEDLLNTVGSLGSVTNMTQQVLEMLFMPLCISHTSGQRDLWYSVTYKVLSFVVEGFEAEANFNLVFINLIGLYDSAGKMCFFDPQCHMYVYSH